MMDTKHIELTYRLMAKTKLLPMRDKNKAKISALTSATECARGLS